MFERHLEQNLLAIRDALVAGAYRHGSYQSFTVYDPKRRVIHAPIIRDQIVHQMAWNVLFPFFDRRLSSAAMSCRPGRGTHAAVTRIRRMVRRMGKRDRVSVLHLDIVQFFDSVSHDMLRAQLRRWVACERTLALLDEIIGSYRSDPSFCASPPFLPPPHERGGGMQGVGYQCSGEACGIPLGNLTSQLFANVVLMPFDRMVEVLGLGRSYARYADDVFVIGTDKDALRALGVRFRAALCAMGFACRWRVRRHEGFEALGARLFPDGCAIRRSTRQRALMKLGDRLLAYAGGDRSAALLDATVASFRGLVGAESDVRWSRVIAHTALAYAPS